MLEKNSHLSHNTKESFLNQLLELEREFIPFSRFVNSSSPNRSLDFFQEHTFEKLNPLCGDRIQFRIRYDQSGHIHSSEMEAEACLVCKAMGVSIQKQFASKTLPELLRSQKNWEQGFWSPNNFDSIHEKNRENGFVDFEIFYQLNEFLPGRIKCALLPWEALDKWNGVTA